MALSRIQEKNRSLILKAAMEVFSQYGFRGSTLDQVAKAAGMSKPNLLYYFPSKEAIHATVLSDLLDNWLDPLEDLKESDDPIEEIMVYVRKKLIMAREYPMESRIFANEILSGAPNFLEVIEGRLKTLVDEKVVLIQSWIDAGKIAKIDPYHLIFSIWSTTQHYADFDVQIRGIIGNEKANDPKAASEYIEHVFRRIMAP